MFRNEVKIRQFCGARTFVHLPQLWSADALLLRGGSTITATLDLEIRQKKLGPFMNILDCDAL